MKKFYMTFLILAFSLGVFAGGEPDTTFSGDGISVNYINQSVETGRAVLVQPDGKIIIVGDITEDNTTGRVRDIEIRRLLADGQHDTTFGNNGIVFLKIGTGDDWATGAALQTDGKIVIVGGFFNQTQTDAFIARLNPNGTPDTAFGTAGIFKPSISILDDSANAVAIQADRKIVVAGYRGTGTAADSMVLRLNSNGSFDITFGSLGRVFLSMGSSAESFRAVAIQADGKIVAAGDAASGFGSEFAVARFNSNGTTDATFGTSGRVTTSVAVGTCIAKALKIQADRKIVVAGPAAGDFGVVRYLSNGSLDLTFSGDGKQTTDFSSSTDSAETLQILPDGKIFVAGTRTLSGMKTRGAAQYAANGTLDLTFSADGKDENAPTAFSDDGITASALKNDGSVIAVNNYESSGQSRITYREYDSVGNSTSTFPVGTAITAAPASVLLPDGKILIGGHFDYWKNSKYTLMRLNADGSLDTTFGNAGRVVGCASSTNCGIYDLKRQSDGRIVAAAKVNGNSAVLRFNPDGTLDSTFGVGGVAAFNNIFSNPKAIEIDSAGRILAIAGRSNNFNLAVYRLTSLGVIDNTFTATSLNDVFWLAETIALQPDGKVVVGGTQRDASNSLAFKAIRLTTSGAIDQTFGTNGQIVTEFSPAGVSFGKSLAIANDGGIVLGGTTHVASLGHTVFAIARYTAEGQTDSGFGVEGKVTTQLPTSGISSIALQPDGKIVAAGYSRAMVTKGWPFVVARYLPAGALDQSFGTNGVAFFEPGQGQSEASKVLIDGSNRIVVTGQASRFQAAIRILQ